MTPRYVPEDEELDDPWAEDMGSIPTIDEEEALAWDIRWNPTLWRDIFGGDDGR